MSKWLEENVLRDLGVYLLGQVYPNGPMVPRMPKNQPVDLVEKNSQILTEYPSRNKESNKKKMVHNSELGWEKND